jgi:hypothetical protein
MDRALGIIALIWIAVCIFFVIQGGKKNRKPGFDKYPIILGIAAAGVIGLGCIIGYLFF